MKAVKSTAYFGVGGILILNFLIMIWVSNLNLGLIGSFLLGCYFLTWGILSRRFPNGVFIKRFRVIHRLFLAGVAFLLMISLFLGIYGNCDTVDYHEDALIVLGAAVRGDVVSLPLKYRLDKAVEYANQNPGAVIVVSGGQGAQETVTEAYAMEQYLIKNGVTNLILKEEKATSTAENFRYSKEILDAHFSGKYRTAFITNGFHIYRASRMAQDAGLEEIAHLHGKIAWYNVVHNYLRESLAVLKYWILG